MVKIAVYDFGKSLTRIIYNDSIQKEQKEYKRTTSPSAIIIFPALARNLSFNSSDIVLIDCISSCR